MRSDKEKAVNMRKLGKSYGEIHAALRIPKSTLSEWFSSEGWSENIKSKLREAAQTKSTARLREVSNIRGEHLKKAYEEALTEARNEFTQLRYNPLFIAGLMLYWGEGDKVNRFAVRLVNSEADMVKLFYTFLVQVCAVPQDKIWASILIYPDNRADDCIKFWSKQTGISKEKFQKCTVIQGKGKRRSVDHGICTVGVSSTYLKVKFVEWIRLMSKELMNRGYYENI